MSSLFPRWAPAIRRMYATGSQMPPPQAQLQSQPKVTRDGPVLKDSVVLEYKPRSVASTSSTQATDRKPAEAPHKTTDSPKRHSTAVAVIEKSIPYSQQPLEVQKRMYKKAAGKWTRGMISLPILIMSSYWLFDRLVLGNEKKEFPESWKNPPVPKAETGVETQVCDTDISAKTVSG
ncbi:hypothetical protein Cpir12675_002652 [Ceratocystis pirilliformis]|uniref:Uncharacterized protein n=1 Tax=Ceratocystis pirilliformis TaxID=259994 RepID=A0ABR3ZB11_9PEZI